MSVSAALDALTPLVLHLQTVPFETACVATAVFTALLVGAEWADSQLLRYAFKPVASLAFICAALSARASVLGAAAGAGELAGAGDYSSAVVGGLALSWWGDVLLIPKSEPVFKLGILAFLLGHVMYALAFLRFGVAVDGVYMGLGPIIPFGILVLYWLLPHVDAGMMVPVLAYVVVICTMVVFSAGALVHGATDLVPLGAVMFLLSDLFVARERFVAPSFANRLIGLPLYYASQLVLAFTIFDNQK